jgi:hypothetical protein
MPAPTDSGGANAYMTAAEADRNAETLIKHGAQPLCSPSVLPNLFATFEVGRDESLFEPAVLECLAEGQSRRS